MLTLEGVQVTQGGFTLRADVQFAPGVTALLGPSGAGKSTLLNVVAGYSPPDKGRVLWQGQDITHLPPDKRPVAMLFQDNNLFPHLSVEQNLSLALTRGRPNATQRDQMAQALLRVGLEGFGTRKPAALSGGQQSRVALARVLLQARPLVLLDEPFAALGPALKAEMLDLVSQVASESGLQVIMVSHDPRDARRIADHAAVVAEGAVTPPAPTEALLSAPPRALSDYLGPDAL